MLACAEEAVEFGITWMSQMGHELPRRQPGLRGSYTPDNGHES